MSAGLGSKTFITGEVLTAGDVNGYLMQGVLVFASSAARAAAITSPQEGQYSYLKDTNSTEYYDGAAWIAAPIGDITGVTAGTGISGGGTSGTVTVTNSMATEIAAAGDIIMGTGSATFDNLPIGTTGQVLTADTTVSPYKVKWATPATSSSGLTLIQNSSFSAVANTSTTFDGVFSSTYDVYKVVIRNMTASGGATTIRFNFRYGTTTETAAYYGINATLNYAATANNVLTNGLGYLDLVVTSATVGGIVDLTVNRVAVAGGRGTLAGNTWYQDGSAAGYVGGQTTGTNNYTGFILTTPTGTMSGQILIYGLAK